MDTDSLNPDPQNLYNPDPGQIIKYIKKRREKNSSLNLNLAIGPQQRDVGDEYIRGKNLKWSAVFGARLQSGLLEAPLSELRTNFITKYFVKKGIF